MVTNTSRTRLGRWLADAIEKRGKTPNAVAKDAGVTHPTVSMILSGKSGTKQGTDRQTVTKLATATVPEGADTVDRIHHINRGLVANNMLPESAPPGGAIVLLREGEDPQYVPGAPPAHIEIMANGEKRIRFRTGEAIVVEREDGDEELEGDITPEMASIVWQILSLQKRSEESK